MVAHATITSTTTRPLPRRHRAARPLTQSAAPAIASSSPDRPLARETDGVGVECQRDRAVAEQRPYAFRRQALLDKQAGRGVPQRVQTVFWAQLIRTHTSGKLHCAQLAM